MVSALDRKLLRDLSQMKGQSIAIIAVMACGVATFVMSLTTLQSLEQSQAGYYDRYRFAHAFARVKRAPQSLAAEIGDIPGMQKVQTRIVSDVTLDVPNMSEPAIGRIISVPDFGRPMLNDLYLREGRYIEPGRPGEVIVGESFALAHDLHPGDKVSAVLNGRFQELNIVGVVLSPEYILSLRGLESLPDERRFGVFWMAYEELAAAFDMDGAFNDIIATLMPGASEEEVIRRIDQLTEEYGGIGAYGRKDQVSNKFLTDEIRSLRGMGLIVPIIFLAVAAFLLNVVMSRLIATQREQIAALKAFGYTNIEVGIHYLKFVFVIAAIGSVIGVALGIYLASGLTELYAKFYKFPAWSFSPDARIMALGLMVATGAATLGTLGSVRSAVVLPAAQAMRPEPPANFRPTIVERLGLQRIFAQPARMVLRQLERRPVKASLSVLGISMAVAVLVLGRFLSDALDHMIEFWFYTQQRQDVTISFVEPTSNAAMYEIMHLPGVTSAEPVRSVAARLTVANRSRRAGITGIESGTELFRVINKKMHGVPIPRQGLVINDKLADVLHVKPGETIRIEIMEGKRGVYDVPVVGIVEEYAGLNAYMHIDALDRMIQEGDTISGAFLAVDAKHIDELYRTLKETPHVAAVTVKEASVKSFNDTQAENQRKIQFFNVIFACIIAAGVVYNTARISLSERSRELATLRVIGFTRGEISAILLGELAVLVLCALPIGMVMGYFFAGLATLAFQSESFRIPLVVTTQTYGFAALVVIIAAIASGLAVRRRLDHLDLVSVLKSKE